jgi:hypothetical protein
MLANFAVPDTTRRPVSGHADNPVRLKLTKLGINDAV